VSPPQSQSLPQPQLQSKPAALIAGHGTRSDAGVAEFSRFIERVGSRLAPDGIDVGGGFIELAPPPLAESVADLVERGHRHLIVVPLVLVAAGHAKGDIPAAMAREQLRHPGLTYAYGRPLGPHPLLQELLAARIDEALSDSPRQGTAVVVVGRGSSDPDANAEIAKVSRLLWEGRQFDMTETSFVSLAWPGVPAALERVRLLGARRIVVAPYFLFPGVLPDRIVEQSTEFAQAHPDLDVRVAGVLGDSDQLAGLVVERYREAVAGDIRMNCDTCIYRAAIPGFLDRVGAPQRPHHHPSDPSGEHERPSDHVHQH
jgi:sirohydrochlorin cobaltochelatase